jgi:hypothetical protein
MEASMKKRLAAAALSLVLLTGCGPARQQVLPLAEEPAPSGPEIAYVPLDDRPDNVERVVYLAESLGYRLAMPELADYRTALDGQPKNYDSLQCGNPWSLLTWVLDQEAAGCDRYILSLDQLHSGGLVSSRCVTDDEIPIPGGGTTSSSGLLDHLLSALAEDPDNTVWLLDSVMRLAPTVGYEGGTLEDYNALRAYGAAERPALSSSEPDAEEVCALYRLGRDGQPLDAAEFGLTEEQVSAYLTARSRKLSLSERVLHTVQRGGCEQFRVLIGIDDSSEAESIQKNEIAYLRSQLREGDALLSGVDDLAFKAVTKLYLEESGWAGADVSVEYFGGTELQPACAYDYQPLKTIVEEHLAFFGLTETPPEAAQLRILVLTQPAETDKKDAYIHALVSQLKGGAAQIPTILIDAGNGTYGTAFHEALTKETELGRLLSYAGFLDMAIVTGTALSHGVARYAFLHSGTQTDATERAFLRTLADSILKDVCYKHVVREDLLAYIRQDLGGDPNNFWQPEIDRNAVLAHLEQGMEESTRSVLNNLERSRWIASLPPAAEWTLRDWPSLELTGYRFPWDRAFEIGMDILMSPLEPVS